MGERTDLPKIKPTEQPSVFNHDMGKGGFWGGITGFIIGNAVTARTGNWRLGNAINIGGAVTGGLIGGMQGKAKTEQELQTGRVVKTPGYFNKGIITGMAINGLMSSALIAVGKFPYNFLTAAIGLTTMTVGSVMRKNSLQRDFDRSVAVREEETNAVRSQLNAAHIANGGSYKNSVSADEAATLAAKQERSAPMAEKIHADRAHHEVEAEAAAR